MAIKFGTNNVNDVVWNDTNDNDKVVTAVNLNDTFIYARRGIYNTGTLPLGVASLAATRTTTLEPTATTNITIPTGGTVFHGDTLSFSATPLNNFWMADCSSPTVSINFLATTTANGVSLSGVTGSPKSRTVNVTTDAHINVASVNYYTGTAAASSQYQANASATIQVSAPYTVSWTASYDANWTGTLAGSSDPSLATYSINLESHRITHGITVKPGTHTKFAVQYYNDSGSKISNTTYATTTYSAWQGHYFTYSTSAENSFWYLANAVTNACFNVVSAQTLTCDDATMVVRSVSFNKSDGISAATLSYTSSTNGQPATVTANASPGDVWAGGALSWTATLQNEYWSGDTSGGETASTSAAAITVSASRIPQTIWVAHKLEHIDTIYITYRDTNDAEHTISTDGATTIADVWCGSYITYTASAAAYWTGSSGTLAPSLNARTVTTAAATPTPRSITIKHDSNVQSSQMIYTPTSNTNTTVAAAGSTSGVTKTNIWSGADVTWSAVRKTYYTLRNGSGTISPGYDAQTINVTSQKYFKNFSVTLNSNINQITVKYGSTTTTFTESAAVAGLAWTGDPITYTPVAATYYKTVGTTTIPAQENDRSVSPTAEHKVRTLTITKNSNVSAITAFYYDNSGYHSTSTPGSIDNTWSSNDITWNASAATGYSLNQSSGTIAKADNEVAVSIAPTASPKTYILAEAWGLGTVTFHTTSAAASSGSNPITSAAYNTTLYIRQVSSNCYFNDTGSTVSTMSLVLNSTNFSLSGTTATVLSSKLTDAPYYRITINSTTRGNVYYNDTLVLSPSFGTQTVYKYKNKNNGSQTSIYAQYVGSMSGSSLLSSANDNYGTASDSYTSSTSAYTFTTISGNKTVNLNGGLRSRICELQAGPDGRQFTVTYRDVTGATQTITHGGFATNNLMSNNTYDAITVWRGATVTWAAASATNWPAASGSFAPGTSTYITINRTSSYDWVTAETHGSIYIPAYGPTVSTSMAASGTYWMAQTPAKITPTTASSKTGTATVTGGSVTYTITSSSTALTLAVRGSTGGIRCPYDLYRVRNTTCYPPAVYRNKASATLVLYNPNDCPVEIYGRFYIAAPGGTTYMPSAAIITSELAAGASITLGSHSLQAPTTWSYSFQCRPCSNVAWGSSWNSMGY